MSKRKIKNNQEIINGQSSKRERGTPGDGNENDMDANSFVLNRTGQFSIEPGMLSNGEILEETEQVDHVYGGQFAQTNQEKMFTPVAVNNKYHKTSEDFQKISQKVRATTSHSQEPAAYK